jgi:predicted RNA-binding protein with RPS1 domain
MTPDPDLLREHTPTYTPNENNRSKGSHLTEINNLYKLLKQDVEIDVKTISQQELVKTLLSLREEVFNMPLEQETREYKEKNTETIQPSNQGETLTKDNRNRSIQEMN